MIQCHIPSPSYYRHEWNRVGRIKIRFRYGLERKAILKKCSVGLVVSVIPPAYAEQWQRVEWLLKRQKWRRMTPWSHHANTANCGRQEQYASLKAASSSRRPVVQNRLFEPSFSRSTPKFLYCCICEETFIGYLHCGWGQHPDSEQHRVHSSRCVSPRGSILPPLLLSSCSMVSTIPNVN